MTIHIPKNITILFFGMFLAALCLRAQITGDLQINVVDATHAAVPNAAIVVRDLDTGTTRTVATDASGSIRVSQLAVGHYEVKVTRDGFNPVTISAQVVSGTSTTVPIALTVATALIESDMVFGRSFQLKPERMKFTIQAQVFNVFNNTTFSQMGVSLSAPSTFGYYSGTDTNSRRIALTGRLTW